MRSASDKTSVEKPGRINWKRVSEVLSTRISDLFPALKRLSFNKKLKFRKPRIYKLRGFTTTSRVDKKVSREQTHRIIRNFLVAAVFVLIISILLLIFNPLKDIKELFRMIGI